MSESGIGDLSRIVSLIMENPKLIEEISNLAGKNEEGENRDSAKDSGASETAAVPKESVTTPVSAAPQRERAARAQLLGALKPYVSSQRASAIDSMLSIAEILDMMRTR